MSSTSRDIVIRTDVPLQLLQIGDVVELAGGRGTVTGVDLAAGNSLERGPAFEVTLEDGGTEFVYSRGTKVLEDSPARRMS